MLVDHGDNYWDGRVIHSDGTPGSSFERMRLPIFSDDGKEKRYATADEIAMQALSMDEFWKDFAWSLGSPQREQVARAMRSLDKYGTSEGHLFITLELAIMVATDGMIARMGNPQMTQLQINQMAGRIADENAPLILAKSDVEVIGSQVTAKIGDKTRYLDRLAKTPGGQVVNVEVKADDAIRKTRQVTFDNKMATEGAVLGNNAPAELQGAKVVIRTYVLRVNTTPYR